MSTSRQSKEWVMLSTDNLCQIVIRASTDPDLRKDLKTVAEAIASTKAYADWVRESQFLGAQHRVPDSTPLDGSPLRRLFDKFTLISDDLLSVKINNHYGRQFLTDGLWVPGEVRVFPFTDESERLLEYVKSNQLDGWADVLIDPATGCGHHAMSLDRIPSRLGFDINPRAVGFAKLNSLMNESPGNHTVVGLNDVRDGLPKFVCDGAFGKVLFTINMPFSLAPLDGVLPLSAYGGRAGSELTFAAMDMVEKFVATQRDAKSVRACILTYSLGREAQDGSQCWAVLDYAMSKFGSAKCDWTLLEDERMWRVNGKKEQPNPMPLDRLKLKADCRVYVRNDARRDQVREGYEKLEEELRKERWEILGYGILDIQVL